MCPAERTAEQELTDLNVQEAIRSLKIDAIPLLNRAVAALIQRPAAELSHNIIEFDARVGTKGLQDASGWLMQQFAREVIVSGVERIPRDAPLLITSNHPGQSDAFAVLAHLPRSDVRIIAVERPLLATLPNTYRYLIFVSENFHQRHRTVHEVTAHLRGGGAVLTFPAGHIEPDPHVRAAEMRWSESVGLLAHLVPDLHILPVAVSGVLSTAALRNPLVSLYREDKQREWVAAVLQTLIKPYQQITVRVRFGEVIHAGRSQTRASITALVVAQTRRLLQAEPE
jgi:hypothetical protein